MTAAIQTQALLRKGNEQVVKSATAGLFHPVVRGIAWTKTVQHMYSASQNTTPNKYK